MTAPPRFRLSDLLQLALVAVLAAGLRIGYVHLATDDGQTGPRFLVQDDDPLLRSGHEDRGVSKAPNDLPGLIHNLADEGAFTTQAPLAGKEEPTAHVAPGYFWFAAQFARFAEPHVLLRWTQCALGAVTACFLFLFARRAFDSAVVALLAGLLAAVHPFWIMNCAEINDGVLTTFLLAAALMLGARGSQSGGAFTSLLYGLALAGLAMVRAALLPFAIVGVLWFLAQCRQVRHGWFNAVLAFLGFANGLAPWAVRNWRLYEEPVPVVTSAYLHLWIGNNPRATGGPMAEEDLQKSIAKARLEELLAEPNQAKRYAMLGQGVWGDVANDPAAFVTRRWQAGLKFLVGDEWFRSQRMSGQSSASPDGEEAGSLWRVADVETLLQGSLLLLGVLGLLGWRWSYAWGSRSRLAALALLWIPLGYVLTHAESLSGPRLPWDAALICFAAYALACVLPIVAERTEEDLASRAA